MSRRFPLRVLSAAALVVAAVQLLALPGDAGVTHKTFLETLSINGAASSSDPQTIVAGTGQTFDFTITNTSSGSQAVPFGSLQILIPVGLTNTSAVFVSAPPNFSLLGASTSSPTVVSTGPTGSGIGPQQSIVIRVQADVPATGICPTTWNTEVKQSNDFSGTGNDFAGNSVSTPVADSFRLVWTTQPSDTEFDKAMSPAPVVSGLDACGNAVSPGGVLLTAAAGQLASTGATSGATSVSFTNLKFVSYDFLGSYGDTLTASANGFLSATSGPFNVVQKLVTCALNVQCKSGTLSSGDGTTTTSITTDTNSTGKSQTMTVSLTGSPTSSCGEPAGVTPEPNYGTPAVLDVTGGLAKTVVATLAKFYVNQFPNNGTPFMDICLQGTSAPFVDKFHDPASTTGLLPDCSSTVGPPCIVSRNKNAGNEVITFKLLGGDPNYNIR